MIIISGFLFGTNVGKNNFVYCKQWCLVKIFFFTILILPYWEYKANMNEQHRETHCVSRIGQLED